MIIVDRARTLLVGGSLAGILLMGWLCQVLASDCDEQVTAEIRLAAEHPWRPPFGLARIGRPITITVDLSSQERPYREYWLSAKVSGEEVARQILNLVATSREGKVVFRGQGTFAVHPDEVALLARCRFEGETVEVARQRFSRPGLEAEAIATPEQRIHPVDLGTILVPHDWLLLARGQKTTVAVAAIHHSAALHGSKLSAWYESSVREKASIPFELKLGQRRQEALHLPAASGSVKRDAVHVSLSGADGQELWRKTIPVMVVPQPPEVPKFGAIETKLRYDAPISVRNPRTGALSTIDYETAWKPELKDVVVFLPNGSRYVFWRGSSYIPFWAGRNNTGICYEWAETIPPADGFTDSVEPLMDKELRYGSVEIVESTPARIHVRWIYQSNDFNYKVWGDAPVEDFYFYPDGYGTRVLTLRSSPGSRYEVLEFILLTPQGAFPYDVLNPRTADILFLDGHKRQVTFPPPKAKPSSTSSFARSEDLGPPRDVPAVYRMRFHKDDDSGAISFNPVDTHLPVYLFSPFYDRGVMVTPFYWGSHWPLARGNSTGWAIDDRIALTPAHNSVIGWGLNRQTPVSSFDLQSIDTLGQSKLMNVQRWVWLIGANDDSDERLLEWAASFSKPPSVELQGGRLAPESYSTERRAIRVLVDEITLQLTLIPVVRCVNPVFELMKAPRNLVSIQLDNRPLPPQKYVWDGQTLWLDVTLRETAQLRVEFAAAKKSN
ncbi:MAG: hypothetical protein AB1898_11925 [Acidobacteriota bacterium]